MSANNRYLKPGFFPETLVDLIAWRANQTPDRFAFSFLDDLDLGEEKISYQELDFHARKIAGYLQSFINPGDRAVLLYQPGLEYIKAYFGCLYAGVIAVPAFPPELSRLERTLPQLKNIVSDSMATVVLTSSSILAMVELLVNDGTGFNILQWMATDVLDTSAAYVFKQVTVKPDSTAFIQYTSGSTNNPKGIVITHGNIIHNASTISKAFSLTPEQKGIIWLPPYYDMGLIGGIIQPLFSGMHCVLMSPVTFLKHPINWLMAITRFHGNVSGGPNFAYDLCVRKISIEQMESLDLSWWKLAFMGAEPIRIETMDAFINKFAICGFRPEAFFSCYGLAEATLFVSGGKPFTKPVIKRFDAHLLKQSIVYETNIDNPDSRILVSCGNNFGNQNIVIVDPVTLAYCPANRVGEIWISGSSIAKGYWNRPNDSLDIFSAYPRENSEGPFLRSGDLGFLYKNELYITGRYKDLIIIDGLNHHPQDIEKTVENSNGVIRPGSCIAFSTDVDQQEKIIIVIEIDEYESYIKGIKNPHDLIRSIKQAISKTHDLSVYEVILLKTGTLDRDLNGKIQREACRQTYTQNHFVKMEA